MNALNIFVKDNFGSRSGVLRLARSRLLKLFGSYNSYRKINWSQIERLIFVCKGNICRSPLGEAITLHCGIPASSYGLDTSDDKPADPRAVQFAELASLDLSGHKTRRIEHFSPQPGDLIIVMEPAQLTYFKNRKLNGAHITLLGLWLQPSRPYIHDPFNSTPAYFQRCEQLVLEATKNIIADIKHSKSFELKSPS